MDIEFQSPTHERLVNDYEALAKRYNKIRGVDSAAAIISTLNVLRAAPNLAEVPRGYRPHPLQGNLKGSFAVDVDKTHRVIFSPNHAGDKEFRIDNHKSITKIFITEIFQDYH